MATERNVVDFKIHNLTEEQFQELKETGQIDPNAVYCTPDTTKERLNNLEAQTANLENTKQDIATAVNYDNITNCITHIPQDIKLELNNGTLTLKAGSKVYAPNGTNTFDSIVIANDLVAPNIAGTRQIVVYVTAGGTSLNWQEVGTLSSGTTDSLAGVDWHLWYDTSNNIIKRYGDSGSLTSSGHCFPIAIVTVSSGTITSIDQVFNGFGYIGGTIFTLPGVKGLVPNGRNADGTLKSANVFNATTVKINTPIDGKRDICLSRYSGYTDVPYVGTYIYDAEDNFVKRSSDGLVGGYILAGKFTKTGGIITDFYVRPPFHAVDYSDTGFIAHQAMPSDRYVDLTLSGSGTNYTASADGYVTVVKNSSATGERLTLRNMTTNQESSVFSSGSQVLGIFLPVSKGDTFTCIYTASGSTNYFRFIYANGAK